MWTSNTNTCPYNFFNTSIIHIWKHIYCWMTFLFPPWVLYYYMRNILKKLSFSCSHWPFVHESMVKLIALKNYSLDQIPPVSLAVEWERGGVSLSLSPSLSLQDDHSSKIYHKHNKETFTVVPNPRKSGHSAFKGYRTPLLCIHGSQNVSGLLKCHSG